MCWPLGVRVQALGSAWLWQPRDPGHSVEPTVEADNLGDLPASHHGRVQRVARRELGVCVQEILREEDVTLLDGKHVVDDRSQELERGLDRVTAIDGEVAVEDLPEDLAARDQAPPFPRQPLQDTLGVDLVGMVAPHKVHGDVGVEKDQTPPACV